jgi:ABC-type thiamin/hydroxymethylpyrimidine transport system permease subunit
MAKKKVSSGKLVLLLVVLGVFLNFVFVQIKYDGGAYANQGGFYQIMTGVSFIIFCIAAIVCIGAFIVNHWDE